MNKISAAFYLLEKTFGRQAMVNFVVAIFRTYSPNLFRSSECISVAKIRTLFGEATNFVEAGKSIPPFMIAYAGDHSVSETEAKILSRRFGEATIENKVFSYAKKNHQTISRELGEDGDKTTEDVLRFLLEKNYVAIHPIR